MQWYCASFWIVVHYSLPTFCPIFARCCCKRARQFFSPVYYLSRRHVASRNMPQQCAHMWWYIYHVGMLTPPRVHHISRTIIYMYARHSIPIRKKILPFGKQNGHQVQQQRVAYHPWTHKSPMVTSITSPCICPSLNRSTIVIITIITPLLLLGQMDTSMQTAHTILLHTHSALLPAQSCMSYTCWVMAIGQPQQRACFVYPCTTLYIYTIVRKQTTTNNRCKSFHHMLSLTPATCYNTCTRIPIPQ